MAKLATLPNAAAIESARGVLNFYANQHGQIIARKWPGRPNKNAAKKKVK